MVGTEHINPDSKDFSAIATKVKTSGADVVYYGGEYPEAGPLSKQIKAHAAPRSPWSAVTASTAPTSSSW